VHYNFSVSFGVFLDNWGWKSGKSCYPVKKAPPLTAEFSHMGELESQICPITSRGLGEASIPRCIPGRSSLSGAEPGNRPYSRCLSQLWSSGNQRGWPEGQKWHNWDRKTNLLRWLALLFYVSYSMHLQLSWIGYDGSSSWFCFLLRCLSHCFNLSYPNIISRMESSSYVRFDRDLKFICLVISVQNYLSTKPFPHLEVQTAPSCFGGD